MADRNSARLAAGLDPDAVSATSRTAPEDYRVGDTKVQSKFFASVSDSLFAVQKHWDKYGGEWRTHNFAYVIPKDQFALVDLVMGSANLATEDVEVNGVRLRLSTLERIRDRVRHLAEVTGKSWSVLIQPSHLGYAEVQTVVAPATIASRLKSYEDVVSQHTSTLKAERLQAVQAKLKIGAVRSGAAIAADVAIASLLTIGFELYVSTAGAASLTSMTSEEWGAMGTRLLQASGSTAVAGTAFMSLTFFKVPTAVAGLVVALMFYFVDTDADAMNSKDFFAYLTDFGLSMFFITAFVWIGSMTIGASVLATTTAIIVGVVVAAVVQEAVGGQLADDFHAAAAELTANARGALVKAKTSGNEATKAIGEWWQESGKWLAHSVDKAAERITG